MSESQEEQPANGWAALLKAAQDYAAEHGPLPPQPPLRFESDPFYFNVFANLPGTLSPGEPEGETDYSADLVSAQGFSCELCSCLLAPLEAGRAELRPIIPLHGAEEAADRLKFAICYAFTAWAREELIASCPADLPHVRGALEQLGFKLQFVRGDAVARGEASVAMEHFRLTVDEWIPGNTLLLERRTTYDADWADVDSPDRLLAAYVGFVALCIDQGDAERAVAVYNRWARWVGLGLIEVKARAPAPSVQIEDPPSTEIH